MVAQERIGSHIGSFLIQKVLQEAASGTLFAAQDPRNFESVWLFLWHTEDAALLLEEAFSPMLARAKKLQSIEMEANLRLREWFNEGPTLCFVFDAFTSPLTLESIKPRLSREQVLSLFSFLAEYLEQYESFDLRVTQITPQQIFVDPISLKVRWMRLDLFTSLSSDRTTQTRAGTLKGNIRDLSPETAMGKPTHPATPFFSLGTHLFEALTKQRAFQADNDFSRLQQIIQHPTEQLQHAPLQNEDRDLLQELFQTDPNKRLHNAQKIAQTLARNAAKSPPPSSSAIPAAPVSSSSASAPAGPSFAPPPSRPVLPMSPAPVPMSPVPTSPSQSASPAPAAAMPIPSAPSASSPIASPQPVPRSAPPSVPVAPSPASPRSSSMIPPMAAPPAKPFVPSSPIPSHEKAVPSASVAQERMLPSAEQEQSHQAKPDLAASASSERRKKSTAAKPDKKLSVVVKKKSEQAKEKDSAPSRRRVESSVLSDKESKREASPKKTAEVIEVIEESLSVDVDQRAAEDERTVEAEETPSLSQQQQARSIQEAPTMKEVKVLRRKGAKVGAGAVKVGAGAGGAVAAAPPDDKTSLAAFLIKKVVETLGSSGMVIAFVFLLAALLCYVWLKPKRGDEIEHFLHSELH